MLTSEATDRVRMAARHLAEASERHAALENERPIKKLAAIQRVMQFPNVLNDKAHSASSAEAVVETDTEYAAYLATCRMAYTNVIMARAELDIASSQMHAEANVLEQAA